MRFYQKQHPFYCGIDLVECMFSWYWLSHLSDKEGIDFVLGHALYMKVIHGGKCKNDKIDSKKIARMRSSSRGASHFYWAAQKAPRFRREIRVDLGIPAIGLVAHADRALA